MAFDVAGEAYQQFMGRFSDLLSAPFADFAGVESGAGMRVLDVGCGPGALTTELVDRIGASRVVGVDPSASFVEAFRTRLPSVEVHEAPAEALPFEDADFDAAVAQLVVLFMRDPDAGVAQMARVTRPGGVVAVTVWDHESGRGPLTPFWAGVEVVDPAQAVEGYQAGTAASDLARRLTDAGLRDVQTADLTVSRRFESFEQWWEPHTFGVGPAGDYARSLDADGLARLREACRGVLPAAPFTIDAVASAARGTR